MRDPTITDLRWAAAMRHPDVCDMSRGDVPCPARLYTNAKNKQVYTCCRFKIGHKGPHKTTDLNGPEWTEEGAAKRQRGSR